MAKKKKTIPQLVVVENVVRTVEVGGQKNPPDLFGLIAETRRSLYVKRSEIEQAPVPHRPTTTKIELHCMKLSRQYSPTEALIILRELGLKTDLEAHCRFNVTDPNFADEFPNCSIWEERQVGWYSSPVYYRIIFDAFEGEVRDRIVDGGKFSGLCSERCWLVGVAVD